MTISLAVNCFISLVYIYIYIYIYKCLNTILQGQGSESYWAIAIVFSVFFYKKNEYYLLIDLIAITQYSQ